MYLVWTRIVHFSCFFTLRPRQRTAVYGRHDPLRPGPFRPEANSASKDDGAEPESNLQDRNSRPQAPTRRAPRRIAKRRIEKAARGNTGGLSAPLYDPR